MKVTLVVLFFVSLEIVESTMNKVHAQQKHKHREQGKKAKRTGDGGEVDENKDDNEELSPGQLCYDKFVDCFNTTEPEDMKVIFSKSGWFDPYKVTPKMIDIFCTLMAPGIVRCMKGDEKKPVKGDSVDPMLETCAWNVAQDPDLIELEINEFYSFYLSYQHLCDDHIKASPCFEIKQRYCVFENRREECKTTCMPSDLAGDEIPGGHSPLATTVTWLTMVCCLLITGNVIWPK